MRRAQISQVFIYLSAIIVIIATIVIGMRLFGKLQETACEAQDVRVKQMIRETLDQYSAYGSRSDAEIKLGCKAETLCFVDKDAIGNKDFSHPDPFIRNSVRDATQNIFVRSGDSIITDYDPRILTRSPNVPFDLDHSWVCVNASRDAFTVRLEGYGRFITASVP